MTDKGGPVNEPTSYGLQPPQLPEQQGRDGTPAAGTGDKSTQRLHAPGPGAAQGGESGGEPGAGRVIGGRYRLENRLGHGGMGTVWRAHDRVVDRDVAVKEPRVPDHVPHQQRQTMYERMRREARTAARIDHPSVVTIHDVVVEDDQPWIVMELVQGQSLGSVLDEGTLSAREAARIGLAVAGALDAAHAMGVLHRDVKPDNVLLGRHDRVVLTDFGIAQVEGEQSLTETGAFVGSPEYVAPERVLGQRPGPESDLWSLGVVLYSATEGVSPFRRSNTPATLQAVLSTEPQRPERARSASGPLAMLLIRMLNKQPAARPDAGEVRATLADVARPALSQPKPSGAAAGGGLRGVLREFGRRLRTSRGWRYGTGGAVVAAAAALALVFVLTADGAPSGWTTHDEDKRVRASIAAPDDYVRSVDESAVTYKDPGDVFSIELSRSSKDVKDNSLQEANSWKKHYEDGAPENYSTTMQDAESAVNEATQQGKEAADMVTTYRDYDNGGPDVDHSLHRRHELIYVNADNVRWRLVVEMPAKGENRDAGEEIYADAVESLEINEQ
ncbi:serine/threonine-protein kinase [Streptomyces winkii]|uniref:serine/threonine-protein kinase n=1 Tax=Streptomyces winkii TaxID=3051178 RepID=UPI0028D75EE4|nr:serine/threonine-protein kinase [Streptomyces sp. DSM 40971]